MPVHAGSGRSMQGIQLHFTASRPTNVVLCQAKISMAAEFTENSWFGAQQVDILLPVIKQDKKTNSLALSQRTNYTD
jgi:hypothetical protein